MKLETLAVHTAMEPDPLTGAVSPPIHLSTTFARHPDGVPVGGYVYARESNPTQDLLEKAICDLEGGQRALVFGSGMAAGLSLLQALEPGSTVLFPPDIYHGFRKAAQELLPKWGLTVKTVSFQDLSRLQEVLTAGVRLVWMETPSNPLLEITALSEVIGLARTAGALVCVDNTFATPVLQRPLDLGADISLHATTKAFGGHSDVMGGALVFRDPLLAEHVCETRTLNGAIASPFASWLILRGIRTLPMRVEAQSRNAQAIAEFLAVHPAVSRVFYPGLPSHPGHQIAKRQMRLFGGIVSFRLADGKERALRAVSRVKVFIRATSLGGVESLIEHRASSEGPGTMTPEDLVRLSLGIEHHEDLIADLEQALA